MTDADISITSLSFTRWRRRWVLKPDDTVLKISYKDRSQLCVEAACHSENVIRCKTSQGATMVVRRLQWCGVGGYSLMLRLQCRANDAQSECT